MDEWQELDKLRKRIKTLEAKTTKQFAVLHKLPQVRIGEIIHSQATGDVRKYVLQGRKIDEATDECYTNVTVFPHDPGPPGMKQQHPFCVDSNGKRFILPIQRTILVQDLGNGNGKHVERDKDGNLTTPPGSVTAPIVTAEPTSSFHENTYPRKNGRVYKGMQLVDSTGADYYIVFQQGHGDSQETFSAVVEGVTLQLETDSSGHLVELSTPVWPFWRWSIATQNWEQLTPATMPPTRKYHSMWHDTTTHKIYIRGGQDAEGNTLSDVWEYDQATLNWTQLPTPVISNAARHSHCEHFLGASSWLYGGYNSSGTKLGDMWQFTPPNTYTAKNSGIAAARLSRHFAGAQMIYVHPQTATRAYLFNTATNSWSDFALFGYSPTPVDYAGEAMRYTVNQCLVAGGFQISDGAESTQCYKLQTIASTAMANVPIAVGDWHGAHDDHNDKTIFFGGVHSGLTHARTFELNVAGNSWAELSPAVSPEPRRGHRMIEGGAGGSDYLYLFGGW